MNTTQFALVSSIYTLGGLLGAISSGPCCNKYGRLLSMRLTTIFFVLGPLFESLSLNIGLMSVGRFLSGVGAGAAIVVVPIYISEVAPPKGKGLFGALTQVMINLGILITQFLGYFLSRGKMWRIILATAGGIGVLQLVGLLFVSESPKWLAEHRYPQKARRILEKIRGDRVNLEAEVRAWNIDSSADDICINPQTPLERDSLTELQRKNRHSLPLPPGLTQAQTQRPHRPRSVFSVLFSIPHTVPR